jgi:hypothetical protein
LHARIAAADAAAVVAVESVSEGRLRARRERALLGELPETFEVKRSPLRPPPLAAGDRALLLLRGARSPYVLADSPGEIIRVADAAMEERWGRAFEEVRAARGDPGRLTTVYVGWIDAGPGSLRDLAAAGLEPLLAADGALRDRVARERAPHAADARAPAGARALSASLAAATPAGASALAEALVAGGDLGDGALVERALRGAAFARAPALAPLFEAACAHPDAALRSAAMRALPIVAAVLGEPALARAKEIAAGDPDARVRRDAEKSLGDVARRSSAPAAGG